MVFALAIGSALFLAGLGRDTIGWPATWSGFVLLTLFAAASLAALGGRLGRVTDARNAAAAST
jgi:hypothetical protein